MIKEIFIFTHKNPTLMHTMEDTSKHVLLNTEHHPGIWPD